MTHVLAKKHRLLAPLTLEIDEPELIYKKFFVVRCTGSRARTLVDSATGQFIALETGAGKNAA